MARLPAKGKLGEPEARLIVLAIAASMPGHRANMATIKDRFPIWRELSPADLQRSPTRRTEESWQQIVGNVVSHQETSTSIFKRGLANRTNDGDIEVTPKGLDLLKEKNLYP
jgi:hypothetical protein